MKTASYSNWRRGRLEFLMHCIWTVWHRICTTRETEKQALK